MTLPMPPRTLRRKHLRRSALFMPAGQWRYRPPREKIPCHPGWKTIPFRAIIVLRRGKREENMDVFQFFTYLKQFNADILLVGAAVWALDLLLGKTLLKNAPARLTAFLPFLMGAALYAAYAAATGGFANGMTADEAISAGITCGSLATVINVVCGKLTAGKGGKTSRADIVKQLLAGWKELSDEEAQALADAAASDEAKAQELLADIAGEETAKLLLPALKAVAATDKTA